MATTVYSNTLLAEVMSDVLMELVEAGQLTEQLAMTTLEQLTQSTFNQLKDQVNAKADINAKLDSYKYYDNVWQFVLQEATMRVNATGGAPKKGAEVPADKLKLVCVDIKLAPTDKQ